MEELSKQLSVQLNETIIITDTEFYCSVVDDKNKIIINSGHSQKLESTEIIQKYNKVKEYRNSINKKFNLDCNIEIYYDDKDLINNIILKYNNNIAIYANSFLECFEKIKKIEELKSQIFLVDKNFNFTFSNYFTGEDYKYEYCFNNKINNISINIYDIDNYDLDLLIKSYNEVIAYKIDNYFKFIIHDYSGDDINIIIESNNIINDMTYTITINTKTSSTFKMYNQFREYVNNNGRNFDFDCDIYRNNENNIHITSYTDIQKNTEFNITINIDDNITSIIKIFNEVKKYIKSIEENNKKQLIFNFNAEYDENIVKNIKLELYDRFSENRTEIETNNYLELSEKIKEQIEIYNIYENESKERDKEREKRDNERENERKEREQKMTIELSKYLKEDVIVKEINNAHFIILGEGINTEYRIKININYFNISDIPDINISDIPDIFPNITNINIREIYTKVKNYKNINLKPEKKCYIETDYTKTNTQFLIKKITVKYDDCEFYGKNYIECDSKILEYVKMNELKLKELEPIKLKEEQEKVVTKLKLKYGDKTDWIITYKNIRNQNLQLDLVISDVDIEYIDLLDIIPNYQANIIMNGYIKNTNYVDYKDIKNKSVHKCDILIRKNILNITIQNCPNLKIINNIIHLENNCYLKIINCPKLEFIENYNNFSEIYKDNSLIKVFNDEIKSLLKDQQEYALIIQSLLKKVNKLENKATENK